MRWGKAGMLALVVILMVSSTWGAPNSLTSKDFTAEELAKMPPEQLAKLVPPYILKRFTPEQLANFTPDELSHLLPTKFPEKEPFKIPEKITIRIKKIPSYDRITKMSEIELINLPIAVEADVYLSPDGRIRDIRIKKADYTILSTPTVVVYSPHPDDETFGSGGRMGYYKNLGYNVGVVLFTRGEMSSVYYDILEENGWSEEEFTREDFANARLREFLAAKSRLGYDWYVDVQKPDGQLWSYTVTTWVQSMEAMLNVVKHIAAQDDSWHPDHKATAIGLRDANVPYHKKMWYRVSYYNYYDYKYNLPSSIYSVKKDALDEYKYRDTNPDPKTGRFGIAYRSTPNIWQYFYNNPVEYFDYRYKNVKG